MMEYRREVDEVLGQNPGLRHLFDASKLMASFQQGQEAGAKAIVAPTLVRIGAEITTSRGLPTFPLVPPLRTPSLETGILGSSVAFRKGYVDGLGQFLTEHGYHSAPDGKLDDKVPNPDVLLKDSGLVGFLKGAQRLSPELPRQPLFGSSQRVTRGEFFNTISQAIQQSSEQQGLARDGYVLGFVAGVARDLGVELNISEVPTDNQAYQAFAQGFRAQERPMPLNYRPIVTPTRPGNRNYSDILSFSLLADSDETHYQTGLRLWLISQGVPDGQPRNTAFWAMLIRHPKALEGFKLGFNGQPLTPTPGSRPLDFKYSKEPFESRTISQLFPESYIEKRSLRQIFSPKETGRTNLLFDRMEDDARQRQMGHNWGQTLSKYKKPDQPPHSS
jgi:hypothetical protein